MGLIENVIRISILGITVYEVSNLAFSESIKRRVRKEQGNICADCHQPAFLEVHHKVPKSRKGADIKLNAVGLCSQCHGEWDRLAQEDGIIYPGRPITQVPRELFQLRRLKQ